MFGYEDKRTDAERKRDHELGDRMRADQELALGFLKTIVRPLLVKAGAETGLAGKSLFTGADLLVESGGVTYEISVRVNHDGN